MEEIKICNGSSWPRECYSEIKVQKLKPMIQRIRKSLIKKFPGRDDDKHLLMGIRFNDDDSVISRLESANQEAIKSFGWHKTIKSALIDCMKSDYYYTFEKDYGEEE